MPIEGKRLCGKATFINRLATNNVLSQWESRDSGALKIAIKDESGLAGWHWIAIQSKTSTWNFSRVSRQDESITFGGFVCTADKAEAITDVEVLELEHNTDGEPLNALYRVTTEGGDPFHVRAKRYRYIPIPFPGGVAFVHENISEFTIEETGETGMGMGMGIDEHIVVGSKAEHPAHPQLRNL